MLSSLPLNKFIQQLIARYMMDILDFIKKSQEENSRNFKVCFYGAAGVGKSSLANASGKTLFIQSGEDRLGYVKNCEFLPKVTTLGTKFKVGDALKDSKANTLYSQLHLITCSDIIADYDSICIDSLSGLSEMIETHVLKTSSLSIEGLMGWSKTGLYNECAPIWQYILRILDYIKRKFKVNIILLGHEGITRIKMQDVEEYEQYDVALFDRKDASAKRLVYNWCDFVGRLSYNAPTKKSVEREKGKSVVKTVVIEDTTKELFCSFENSSKFFAKNANSANVLPKYPLDKDGKQAVKIFGDMA